MTSMKGLLKGLRYISQIFENEKEEEMQIGFPTDVKHVAHIGMDGSSSTKPSWMNEFTPTEENSSTNEASSKPPTKPSTHDAVLTRDISEVQMLAGPSDSPSRQSKPKQSRRHHSSSSPIGSPSRDPDRPRRHKNSGDIGSPARDPATRTRRMHNSNLGSESPGQDKPSVPKSRRKKSKESIGSGGGGSNRSSKSKGSDGVGETTTFHSDPGSGGYGLNNNNNPVLKVYDEGNECDDISRGIRTM